VSTVAILADLWPQPESEAALKFTLTYRGSLRASQNLHPGSDGPVRHWPLKHRMRLQFHEQLRTVWKTRQFLVDNQVGPQSKSYHIERLAIANTIPPWNFVPLITEDLSLRTKIEVTVLRVDHPHLNLWSESAGDVDNRVKTIIDALRMPRGYDGYDQLEPGPDENPMFVLVQDDQLFDAVYAETDHLLRVPKGEDASYAEVTITVTSWPMANHTFANTAFVPD
jgi:Holliday junction resolvase RusA-like endonuclease